MPFVTYVAAENIMVGHVASVTYTFSFSVSKAEPSTEILKSTPKALSGARETLFFENLTTWQITMEPVLAGEADLIEEFLASTANGQQFVFDPYGTPEAPVRAFQCDRDDGGWAPRRVSITGDPAYQDRLEYSFAVTERS